MAQDTIFKQLKSDHENHREMLSRIETMTGESEERRRLFNTFRTEVTAHAAAEEETGPRDRSAIEA